MTDEFVQQWLQKNPGGRVVTRDLAATSIAPLNAEWIAASYTPRPSRDAKQVEVLKLSDELIAELKTADEYVFGVAMHNFSIPSVLKLWIDQISRAGETYSYENGAAVGLLRGRKATFLVASGGSYEAGSPRAAMNFVEPYLRSLFAFLGVTEIQVINAGGTGQARHGVARETILQPAIASIQGAFEAVG